MSELVVNSLWNCNVYLNGIGLLGRAAEVTVPQPKRLTVDYKGLGMAGRVKVPTGWDALEGRIKWSSFDETTIQQLANSNTMQQLSILGDLQTLASAGEIAEAPVIYNLTAICKDIGAIDFKSQELVEFTSMFDVYHVDLTVAGDEIYVYDAMSNVYTVNGVDQLANYRANIGG